MSCEHNIGVGLEGHLIKKILSFMILLNCYWNILQKRYTRADDTGLFPHQMGFLYMCYITLDSAKIILFSLLKASVMLFHVIWIMCKTNK